METKDQDKTSTQSQSIVWTHMNTKTDWNMSKYKYNNVKNYIADLARGGEASGFFHTRAQILTHLFSSHKISTKNEKKFPKNQRFHTIRICSDSSFSWVGAWLRTRTILRVKPVDPLSECQCHQNALHVQSSVHSSDCLRSSAAVPGTHRR